MKSPTPRNRTLRLSAIEKAKYRKRLLVLKSPATLSKIVDRVVCEDLFSASRYLPPSCVDLMVVDPPYNMNKTYNSNAFRRKSSDEYAAWLDAWISKLVPVLKPDASVYICGDWRTSGAIQQVCERYFIVRNRITWEREKGRGAAANWKNNSEDIWFCTMSDRYYFDVDAVKLKRKVLAPYRTGTGAPKDWNQTDEGNFRLTHPSNVWTDLSVPFWSMPENTEHPTQKPEKLLAKIVLASSRPGELVFDPFLGSGTTAVVAKKLKRKFFGIELDEKYACIALKRLDQADASTGIQGFVDGIFYERNAAPDSTKLKRRI